MAQLPYNAKTLPNNPNLIHLPVKGFHIIVPKQDFRDFLEATRQIERGRVFSEAGEHPQGNTNVLVRQNQNGGKVFVMFFRALVLGDEKFLNKVSERVFNLAHDSIVLYEVRGNKLSTKKELLRHKANVVGISVNRLLPYS